MLKSTASGLILMNTQLISLSNDFCLCFLISLMLYMLNMFNIFAVRIPSKVLRGILFVLPSIIFAVRVPSKVLCYIFIVAILSIIVVII